jgi:uncharacterized membrane protein YedE/YeeE
MPIDWALGLLGGLIIGTAAALFLLLNGRIMGASGIFRTAITRPEPSGTCDAFSFIAGLVVVPGVVMLAVMPERVTHLTPNLVVVVAAGLLVGLGTALANGCTSGHGVCGISRLSLRGIVATVFYLLAGGLMVALFRHALGVI